MSRVRQYFLHLKMRTPMRYIRYRDCLEVKDHRWSYTFTLTKSLPPIILCALVAVRKAR